MTEKSKALVTGATGNVGREVLTQLLGTGAAVSPFVRNLDSTNLPDAVEVVQGDLCKPDTLDAALEGVGLVFLADALAILFSPVRVSVAVARLAPLDQAVGPLHSWDRSLLSA